MADIIPPFPIGATPNSFEWNDWYTKLVNLINSGSIPHNSLNGLQGGGGNNYYHLSQAQHTALTTDLTTTINTSINAYFPMGWA